MKFEISIDLGDVASATAAVNKEVFPLLHQVVAAVAAKTAENWKSAVYDQKGLWMGERDKYAQSISWNMTGDFTALVQSTYSQAQPIEQGRPGRDLKKMLDTSPKVRRSESSGKRFLAIPLRHNTPGNTAHAQSMPTSVHTMAKMLIKSRIESMGQRPSGEITRLSPKTGMSVSAKQTPFASSIGTKGDMMTASRNYVWGARLSGKTLAAAGLSQQDQRIYAGLVRMNTGTPGANSSAYMTFRIMMEGQNGWVTQAEPARNIAQKVVEQMRPLALAAAQEAMKQSI